MQINKPEIVTFDVTYACNLSCNMCQTKLYHQRKQFKTRLSKEDIIKTARRLNNEEGANYFRFIGAEPLLHPDIIEIIQEVSKIGNTWLTTNGTLITDDLAEQIINSGLTYLFISYHSTNEHVQGIGMTSEDIATKTINGIAAIDSAKQRLHSSINVTVTNIVTPDNYMDVLKIAKLFNKYDVSISFNPVHSMRPYLKDVTWNNQKAEYFGDGLKEPKALNFWQKTVFLILHQILKSKKKGVIRTVINLIFSQLFQLYKELHTAFIYRPCTKPNTRIGIRSDGKIFACEFLRTIEMGSINDANLWNTPIRHNLIKTTRTGKLEICRQCNRESLYRPNLTPSWVNRKTG